MNRGIIYTDQQHPTAGGIFLKAPTQQMQYISFQSHHWNHHNVLTL